MPQCPSKTKSRWNPKGYFTEKEEKIIVNSGKFLGLICIEIHAWLMRP
jgi:hypothetical protein